MDYQENNVNVDFVIPKNKEFYYKPGEFAVARISSIETLDNGKTIYRCDCIDRNSKFFIPENIKELYFPKNAGVGVTFWAYLKELKTSSYKFSTYVASVAKYSDINNAKAKQMYEYNSFCAHHKVDDVIYCPAILSNNDKVFIASLTANLFAEVEYNEEFASRFFTNDNNFGIGRFIIKDIKGPNHITLIPDFVDNFNYINDWKFDSYGKSKTPYMYTKALFGFWNRPMSDSEKKFDISKLPDKLNNIVIPSNIIEAIKNIKYNEESLRLLSDNGINLQDDFVDTEKYIQFIKDKYLIEHNKKRVVLKEKVIKGKDNFITIDFNLGLRRDTGVPLSVGLKKADDGSNNKGIDWVVNFFGSTQPSTVFDRRIYVQDWKQILEDLDNLTLGDEEWDYIEGFGDKEKFILKQYLKFTFYKLWLDNQIVFENEDNPEEGRAVFNTGLVDEMYDDIYCCLKVNSGNYDPFERPWAIDYFTAWGKGANGKKINELFSIKPARASYFDKNNLSNLFYDTTKELHCDFEHIIEDNLKRIPINYLKHELSYNNEVNEAIANYEEKPSKHNWFELKNLICNDYECKRRVADGLRRAVDISIKYCEWNYKTAIPVYYYRDNSISLLLPLSLSRDNNEVDLALVVRRLNTGNYQGETIFDLPMAYMDARLICRPSSEWLRPNVINTSDSIDEDENFDADED